MAHHATSEGNVETTQEFEDLKDRELKSWELGAATREIEATKKKAKEKFDYEIIKIKLNIPEGEVASWTEQKQEAEAWIADNNADTWLLDAIINRTGEDKSSLVTKIILKSKEYKQALGDAIGERQEAQ